MLENVVYYSPVTEYEGGFGNRADGSLIALDRDAYNAAARKIDSYQGNEFSRTGEISLRIVTPECYALLQQRPERAWSLTNMQSLEYIKRI